MRRPGLRSLVFIAAVWAALITAAPSWAAVYIVMLEPGVDAAAVANEHAARFDGRIRFVYRTLGGYSIDLPDASASAAAAAIARDPRVQGIGPNKTGWIDPPPGPCVAASSWQVRPIRCME